MTANDKQLVAAACASVDASVDQVISQRVTESNVIIVVNNGIAGCPKYIIPIADLKSSKKTAAKNSGNN